MLRFNGAISDVMLLSEAEEVPASFTTGKLRELAVKYCRVGLDLLPAMLLLSMLLFCLNIGMSGSMVVLLLKSRTNLRADLFLGGEGSPVHGAAVHLAVVFVDAMYCPLRGEYEYLYMQSISILDRFLVRAQACVNSAVSLS